jgi:hypothetical protein
MSIWTYIWKSTFHSANNVVDIREWIQKFRVWGDSEVRTSYQTPSYTNNIRQTGHIWCIDYYHILIRHPFLITTLTSYEQYCKPHGTPSGMKNLNKYSGTSVHELPCSRTIRFTNKFSEQTPPRMTNGVSDYEHASWQQRQAESIGAGVSVAG